MEVDSNEMTSKQKGTLKSGIAALEKLKASGFDERDETKKEFMALYHTYRNFTQEAKKT